VVVIEAAVDSLADAERAVSEGAGRLEVCGDLIVGGVTPSRDMLRSCLALGVPCVAMARPRAGDFVYDDLEMQSLLADASEMVSAGAHGVVFGCLNRTNAVDVEAVAGLVRIAENAETVFHRAFDETPDSFAALETLIACGVTRVLTSGHARTALEGTANITALNTRAGGRIAVLPGGTVRADNVRALVARTGVTQVHARATEAGVIAGIRAALGR
jgi:copper homeostasis protein